MIALTQRAVRDRQVRSPETLDDVQSVALATAWLDTQAADPADDPAADEQNKCMTDDHRDRMREMPLPHDGEPLRSPSANILDALDIAGVGEIDIAIERPLRYPRPAMFD